MNRTPPPRDNTEAEMLAFDQTCERLSGFDGDISTEWVDGFLGALAALPAVPPDDVWLPAMLGDTFERVFADPEDQAAALKTLQVRLKVLVQQLDPEALFDDPEAMRLNPWMSEWTDAERQHLVDEGHTTAEEAQLLQTGAVWAQGFLDAVEKLPDLWAEPADEEAAEAFGIAFDQIGALMIDKGSEAWGEHLKAYYPDRKPDDGPTREDLIAEACMSVQDLRMYWVDFAPKTETRRVEPTPGRNDPCPCGSGKKFKKCHGAAA